MANEAPSGLDDVWAVTIGRRPRVGALARRSRRVGIADIEAFTFITGDRNPLHYDRQLAENSKFGRLIVQGGVISGILNAIVAEDLPGPGTVFLGCEWRFVKAVGIDEIITGEVKILTVRDDKPICTLSTLVRDAGENICLEGTAVTYTVPLRNLNGERPTVRCPAHEDLSSFPNSRFDKV